LGHKSVQITEKRYNPWNWARQVQAEAEVQKARKRDPMFIMKQTLAGFRENNPRQAASGHATRYSSQTSTERAQLQPQALARGAVRHPPIKREQLLPWAEAFQIPTAEEVVQFDRALTGESVSLALL